MKQLYAKGKAVRSIWKASNPDAKPEKDTDTNIKVTAKPPSNPNHDGGRKAAPFIPDSYSDPIASAALRNLIREEERLEQEKRKTQHLKKKHGKGRKHDY